MRKARFWVACFASYPAEVELPEKFFKEDGTLIADANDVIDYLEGNLGNIPANDLEFVDDCQNDPIYSAEIIDGNKITYTVCIDGTTKVINKEVQ